MIVKVHIKMLNVVCAFFSRTLQFVYGEMKMANEYNNKNIEHIYICGGNRLKLYGSQNGNRNEKSVNFRAGILVHFSNEKRFFRSFFCACFLTN